MASTVPILPIHQLTYTTERAVITAGDCILHLSHIPQDWSTADPYWTLKQSAQADNQANVKALLLSGNISRNNLGLMDRLPGKLHMIQRPDGTGTHVVFFREALADEVPDTPHIRLFKVGVGALEMSIAVNVDTLGATLQVFLEAPILSTISIAGVSGSLNAKDGLNVDVAYPDFLFGKMRLDKRYDGKKTYARLSWKVTVFKKEYEDSIDVFEL